MIEPDVIESIGRKRSPDPWRPRWLGVFLMLIMTVLMGRGFYIQVVEGREFRERAEYNRVQSTLLTAPRGIIYDRNRTPLVENISSTDLVIDPIALPKSEHEELLLENLPKLVPELSAEEVREALMRARESGQVSPLRKALDYEEVLVLREKQQELPGVLLSSSLVRNYLHSTAASHVLGYTGSVTSDDLATNKALHPIDIVGKQGIERQYDEVLRGTNGFSYVEVNAGGAPQADLGKVEPVSGQDLQLSLDIELQEFVYGLFSERAEEKREAADPQTVSGAVVVLQPQTGEVLASVSYPAYDPNVFSQPGRRGEAEKIFSATENPLFNRVTDGTFASGSTIKPFLALAGLEAGIITADTTVLSTGGIEIGQWSFPDWKAGGHGLTDVKKAIAESVNTFFYLLAGGDETHTGLGVERARGYLEQLGWNKPTGIDLPSEAAGFLPSKQWKEEVKEERWYIGDTYHFGIGQGDVLTTPLQVASSTAALATGTWRQPQFVPSEGKVAQSLPFESSHITTVQQGMRQTITEGSGRLLSDLSVPLAGKTGTAQVGGSENTHAWFTSYAPYEHPKVVVVVLLEKGGGGDTDAVPFAKEVWSWIIEHRLQNNAY